MKNFVHITRSLESKTHQFLESACQELGLQYIPLVERKVQYKDCIEIKSRGVDLLYRSRSRSHQRSVSIELLLLQEQTKTIYNDNDIAISGIGPSVLAGQKIGLPVVPNIPFLPAIKREAYDYADELGGFPLVVKVSGGMEGIGVMKVDSAESLNSVSDYLKKDTTLSVNVQKYIPHEYFVRVVVVDGEVVASTMDYTPKGDFRANARGYRGVESKDYVPSEQMCIDAIRFTEALNVKASGIDFLIQDDGSYYISEANCPFNFAETQERTGVDIAKKIIEAIMK